MKSSTHSYLFEDEDVEISYDDFGLDGAVVGIRASGQTVGFAGQRGELLAIFRAVEHALLEREGIKHVHLGSDSEAVSQEPF